MESLSCMDRVSQKYLPFSGTPPTGLFFQQAKRFLLTALSFMNSWISFLYRRSSQHGFV